MSNEHILILGAYDDAPSVYIYNKIVDRGGSPIIFDTRLFPSETLFTFNHQTPTDGFFQFDKNSKKIPFQDIKSVYRRCSKGINAPHEDDQVLQEVVYWNIESAVGTFCRCLDSLWVNSTESSEMHKYKGYQLKLLHSNGIRVPNTIITNDPQEVLNFYENSNQKLIFKPVRGWAYTEMLTKETITPARLATLSCSPITIQEHIPGRDIRVYIVKDEIFAMEIDSNTLDFREDTTAKRIPITLPAKVQKDCKKIAKILDLVFTGIDMRLTPEGEYVYFEANPTPVFIYDEQSSGYPISDRILDLLFSGK